LAVAGPCAGIGLGGRSFPLVNRFLGGIDRLVDLLVYFLVGLGFLLGDGFVDVDTSWDFTLFKTIWSCWSRSAYD
jgi:hypothetical protein